MLGSSTPLAGASPVPIPYLFPRSRFSRGGGSLSNAALINASFTLDGDTARAGVGGAWRRDHQQPIAVLRRHPARVHLIRQLHRPHEPPCRPLAAVHPLWRKVA
jgi:hypothetical protein